MAKTAAKRNQAAHNYDLATQLREAKIIGKDAEDLVFDEDNEKELEKKQLAFFIQDYWGLKTNYNAEVDGGVKDAR